MCGSGNRTSCTCSGFCFRLYIVGVVVDQNADILQLLDLVGIHGVVPKVHPDEHDARFQLCDRFDPIIVSIDEIDGKISFQTGKAFNLIMADIDMPERCVCVKLRKVCDLVAAHIEIDQLLEAGHNRDIRNAVAAEIERFDRRAAGQRGNVGDLIAGQNERFKLRMIGKAPKCSPVNMLATRLTGRIAS